MFATLCSQRLNEFRTLWWQRFYLCKDSKSFLVFLYLSHSFFKVNINDPPWFVALALTSTR